MNTNNTENRSPRLAQVIVDIPTMQTDRPYTYKIPKELKSQIRPGMRVTVPFGYRNVQGFIVGFANSSKYRLKYIKSVMDLVPAVNTEMLKLSKWLAETTFSFRINCLMTMLPTAMKAVYRKRATLIKKPNAVAKRLFGNRTSININPKRLTSHQTYLLIKLQHQHLIKVSYVIKNKAKSAKVIGIKNRLSHTQLTRLIKTVPSSYKGQQALLSFLFHHPKYTYSEPNITKKIPHLTASVLKSASRKKWVTRKLITKYRNPYRKPIKRTKEFKLTPDQMKATRQINDSITHNQSKVFLLEGVTGSGKTEVYLHSMHLALKQGKSALMLVPEISLTPQMVNWVKSRFGNEVAILHSGLSAGEKYDEWCRIRNGQARVVIGARSAIFAPLRNLGLIIMDEEHDSSYKQNSTPRYQTRNVAKWRGKYNHCPVVMGSATPSLESRARALKGRYQLLLLPHRVNRKPLPTVHVVDMRKDFIRNHRASNYSVPLLKAIRKRIKRHEQVVLMLNRRGYASYLMCQRCGYVPKCPNCDISLTFHYYTRDLRCHYCGYRIPVPHRCPNCHSNRLNVIGTGTEQAELELQKLVPQARIVRMDVDTTSRKGAHAKLLHKFGSGQGNILLGTQMIAKGLDFPNVTLVGVLDADTTLNLPSFRSAEQTFQLLTQVSGRAGRAKKSGEVFIQTFTPNNYAIQLAKQQNYEKFFAREMQLRHQYNYPPYYFMVKLMSASTRKPVARATMYQIRSFLLQHLSHQTLVIGPAPAPIDRIKRKYYYQLTIRYKYEPQLQKTLDQILDKYQSQTKNGIYLTIDPEPLD